MKEHKEIAKLLIKQNKDLINVRDNKGTLALIDNR